MATVIPNRKRRDRQERRGSAVVFALGALLAFIAFAWMHGPAYVAYFKYSPREGDILFQSLPRSRLVDAIEGVSESPFSHCGIATKQDGQWVVYEALGNVGATPLKEFIFRGRDRGFAVYRFESDHQEFIPATLEHAKTYFGRPYDTRYRMDDERIYCTELIYKAYRESSGQELGELVRLGDLNWRPFEDTIEHFESGPVPLDREMITPKGMAEAHQLELAFAHRIAVADS